MWRLRKLGWHLLVKVWRPLVHETKSFWGVFVQFINFYVRGSWQIRQRPIFATAMIVVLININSKVVGFINTLDPYNFLIAISVWIAITLGFVLFIIAYLLGIVGNDKDGDDNDR